MYFYFSLRYVIPMYLALSIFLFAVSNTNVSRTFYININITSNIYSEILLIDKLSKNWVREKWEESELWESCLINEWVRGVREQGVSESERARDEGTRSI
jgi:hypothetical protein